MAAHDEKILSNRRRLFKALSVAPVVMTLRPGTAAAGSAYQCAIDVGNPSKNFIATETDPPSCQGAGCYAYQRRRYWNVAGCGYSGVPAIVVETRPGVYVAGNGDIVSVTLNGNKLTGFSVTTSQTYTCNDPSDPSEAGIASQSGLFLVVGQTTPVGQDPTFFDYHGVYPEKQLGGGLQGMTGTCLGSIPSNVGAYTVARG